MNRPEPIHRAAEAPKAAGGRRQVSLLLPLAVLFVLSALSWTASYFYNYANADVTVPDGVVILLQYATEILSAVRVAVMLALIACLLYAGVKSGTVVMLPLCSILADALAGLASTALSQGYGVFDPLRFLWEVFLSAAAFLIASLMLKKRKKAASAHEKAKRSVTRAAVFCALPAALLPVGFAVWDFAGHIGSRGAYTPEDYQAGIVYFAGLILREILVYAVIGGAAAYLTAEIAKKTPLFRKNGGNRPRIGPKSPAT